jgi:hypothetical protein
LIENRTIINEFARSYYVGTFDEEVDRLKEEDDFSFLNAPNRRDRANYDILNLNPDHPNTLIEKVEGTVADIYGNLVDLNRNVIFFPKDDEGRKDGKRRLSRLANLHRRSIKMHYEINARKEVNGDVATTVLDGPDLPVGHNHSRWSIDVDGEGLTKINVPASSNTGNIPLLARHITAHQRAKRKDVDFRAGSPSQSMETTDNQEGQNETGEGGIKDILHLAFGSGLKNQTGVTIPEDYAPLDLGGNGKILYRTAYHDIVATAEQALSVTTGPTAPTIATTLTNTIPEEGQSQNSVPNAGGRSMFVNLDGSLELNIGRDTVDHKSIVLDTSGGIVSRIGKTNDAAHGASIISQLDGSVYIQVGGDKVEGDASVDNPTVRFVVKGPTSNDEITIDENGIRIRGGNDKNIILDSQKDIILAAKGRILMLGSTIGAHGSIDETGTQIATGPHKVIVNDGKQL